ncbi:acyl-CoA N-acyltransferase [Aaosphaeria arxii CBS 175.79]|uniref:Acyl-CoA N-acyltransferase n=1 Tax=Aaosphaeria arxii CBS 175.79 TaxID=1450172 RepID=A0A6A5Y5M0_9PLEO|nr:acyl-CoA N-acyltransferase [Aaosphaeria arxii CBS 175.79]KAF2020141.1 acyl-CoA N-acyltransferase [Aaosphaeria arxii CBS 175.79]
MSVTVEHYNPAWPTQFQTIKTRLETFLTNVPVLSIEHVGSTSVPGLAAKPTIDIDIIVARENVRAAIDSLVANGNFTDVGELGIVDRHVMRDPEQDPRRNIYVCVDGAFSLRNHLSVRDTLRGNPELRDEYARVKLELAARDTNIVDYVEAKGDVVQKILRVAGLLSEEELAAIRAANFKGERFGALKTERLTLREFILGDAEGFYRLESIPEVVRYQNYGPRTREEAHKSVVSILQNSTAKPRKHVELAVDFEGRLVGRVGALIAKEDEAKAGVQDPPKASLFFSFLPEVQGKGLATEAMRAFIPLLGSPLKLEIECDPRNEGSWKMAERLGFKKTYEAEKVYESKGEWVDSVEYSKLV